MALLPSLRSSRRGRGGEIVHSSVEWHTQAHTQERCGQDRTHSYAFRTGPSCLEMLMIIVFCRAQVGTSRLMLSL